MAGPMSCQGPECGNEFEAKRSTAKFCSNTCRQRASRDRKATEREKVIEPDPDAGGKAEHSLLQAVRRELTAANALDTVDGQLALQIARRIAEPDGTGVSALTKELRSLMIAAKAAAPAPATEPPPVLEETPLEKARRARDEARQAAGLS